MYRRRAIEALLVRDVAGIAGPRGRSAAREDQRGEDERVEPPADSEVAGPIDPPGRSDRVHQTQNLGREDLEEAEKKALRVVLLCWAALLILLVFHSAPEPFLSFEGVDAVFSLSALVIAVYSGFRLGQWEKFRSVRRSLEDLDRRAE